MSDADSVTSDNVPGSTSDINSPQTNKSSCDTTTKSPHKSTTFSPARKKLARTTTNEGQLPGIDIDIPIHITDLNSHTDSGAVVAISNVWDNVGQNKMKETGWVFIPQKRLLQ